MVRKPAKRSGLKKKILYGTLAFAAGAFSVGVATKTIPIPLYSVERVVDGDTFVTTDNQMIRILGIDAPELGMCGGDEATKSLTKILEKSPLYIKIVYRDSNHRLYGTVYNSSGSVAKQQLRNGMALMLNNSDTKMDNLNEALAEAKENKRGVFSSKCTQVTNPNSTKCIIKGNNRRGAGSKPTYHFPGCGEYNLTIIQLYDGDRWFCTENEALKAGYVKGSDCFEKTFK